MQYLQLDGARVAVVHAVAALQGALGARTCEAGCTALLLHWLGAHRDLVVAAKGEFGGGRVGRGRSEIEPAVANKARALQQGDRARRPDTTGARQLGDQVGGLLYGGGGAREQTHLGIDGAQRQCHALTAAGHAGAARHGEFGGVGALFGLHLEVGRRGLGPIGFLGAARSGIALGHGHHCRSRRGRRRWRREVQRPWSRQAALAAACWRAGGQAQLHAAPVLAAGLGYDSLALQVKFGRSNVQRGAVAALPVRATHLVGQPQGGFALACQLHLHVDHARALARCAFAIGQQGFEAQFQRFFLALQLVGALLAFLGAAAQGVCRSLNLRRAGRGGPAALGGRSAGHGLEVAVDQLQRAGGGGHVGEIVLQAADFGVQWACAGAGQGTLGGLHAQLTDTQAGVADHLQALRIQSGGQTDKLRFARPGRHAQRALHGGAALVERDLVDAGRGSGGVRCLGVHAHRHAGQQHGRAQRGDTGSGMTRAGQHGQGLCVRARPCPC